MKKKTRRILFYVCFLAFLGISYITLLYAQGYKYSFSENKFFRTGAVSLTSNTGAKVFVDDELAGETSFLSNAFSRGRLLPGRYSIRLQRDGYSSWQKTVAVQEGRVIDFPHVMLLPQDEEASAGILEEIKVILSDADQIVLNPTPTPKSRISPSPTPSLATDQFRLSGGVLTRIIGENKEKISTNVRGFSFSPSGQEILWWTSNELWVMWLDSVEHEQPFHNAGDKELITRLSSLVTRAGWFRGDYHIVVESNGYRVVEVDKRGGINIIRI